MIANRSTGLAGAWIVSGAVLLAATPAAAETVSRVIELFTSQGCPKCPPADRLITDLARQPDTVALSFAVNYWDYAGWKDTLASPVFTHRQHAYAAARGDHLVYTPQVVVDGIGAQPGADRAAILRDAETHASRSGVLSVPLAVSEQDGHLLVDIGAAPRPAGAAAAGVFVLRVARAKTVDIGRGENSGRTVTYTNAVRAMSRVGEWDGRPVHLKMPELAGDDEGYVVLLQEGTSDRPGPILAAAKTAGL